MSLLAGCNHLSQSPDMTLHMVRIINLSEEKLTVELTASNAEESGTPLVLYSGKVGTQAGDADAGEIILHPAAIEDPLQYSYKLSISEGLGTRLSQKTLMSAYRSESSDSSVKCMAIDFNIRDPNNKAEIWGDPAFWKNCESAPGTVAPSPSS
jgi:hypothetical protein